MACVNIVPFYRDTYFIDLVVEAFEVLDEQTKRDIQSQVDHGSTPDDSTDFLADDFGGGLFGDSDYGMNEMDGWI